MQTNSNHGLDFWLVNAITLLAAGALFWPVGVAMAFPGIPLAEGAFWVAMGGGLLALPMLWWYPGRVAVLLAVWLPFSDLSYGLEIPVQAKVLPLVLCGALAGRAWLDGYRLHGFNARVFVLGVASMIFSALVSEHIGHSVLTLMAWTAPFAAFFFYLQSPRFRKASDRMAEWKRLLLAAGAAGIVLLTYVAFGSPFPGKAAIRPFFLNANFFSAYLCLVLPGLVWVVRSSAKGSVKQYLAMGMAVIIGVALVVLRSRGIWIGLGGGLLLALYFWLDNWLQRGVLLAGGLVLALVFAGIMRQYLEERPALPGDVRYVLSAGDLQSDFSNRERLMRWKCAWRMGNHQIGWGHGPGNFAPKFKHYLKTDTEVRQISYWFGWTGGAHSVWMTSFAETGILGLVLLIGLIAGFVREIGGRRRYLVDDDKMDPSVENEALKEGKSSSNLKKDLGGGMIGMAGLMGLVAIGSWAVAGIFNDLMMVGPLAAMLGMYFGALSELPDFDSSKQTQA